MAQVSAMVLFLQEEIRCKNARIHYLGEQEMQKAREIQALIMEQSRLFDDVTALEIQLAREKKENANVR